MGDLKINSIKNPNLRRTIQEAIKLKKSKKDLLRSYSEAYQGE